MLVPGEREEGAQSGAAAETSPERYLSPVKVGPERYHSPAKAGPERYLSRTTGKVGSERYLSPAKVGPERYLSPIKVGPERYLSPSEVFFSAQQIKYKKKALLTRMGLSFDSDLGLYLILGCMPSLAL